MSVPRGTTAYQAYQGQQFVLRRNVWVTSSRPYLINLTCKKLQMILHEDKVDKVLKKVFILDPRPVNEKHKDYPVGPYTRKIVCISENLMRGMRRCGWVEDIAKWVHAFPDISHEHETQSGYLVYLFMSSWSNGELRLPTYKGCGDVRKQFLTHLLMSPGNDSELSTPDGLNNLVLSLYDV
uniref:Uncharacterized protein n=1 Tax=Leersia perrieri TaxID=77586 RepID=A0A0D9VD19_9ORYZ